MKHTRFYRILFFFCACLLLFALSACSDDEKPTETESESESESASVTDEPTELPTEEENTEPKKRVAFTFDDGPHPMYTKRIVDCARAHGGRVTFFVVGYMLNRSQGHADAFLYALDADCEVGLHGFSHINYDECDEETFLSELSRTLDAAKRIAPDFKTALMRPVGGRIPEEYVKICPYAVVKWNVDTRDWERHSGASEQEREKEIQAIVDEIVKSAKDGSIILMHDLYENTVIAFERAAEILASEGYEFVTVSELLGEDLQAGKIFSKGKPIEAMQTGKNK